MENASAVAKGTTKTARTSSTKNSITALAGITKAAGPWANLAGVNGDTQLAGEGTTSRDVVISTTLTARVSGVLPNGAMLVEATKEVEINSERQIITVRGIVRPADVASDNTVRSDRLGQLEVHVNGKGVVGDAIQPAVLPLSPAARPAALLTYETPQPSSAILLLLPAAPAPAARLKDLVAIEGVRDNQLIGYGLVVGLAGTGDRRQALFSAQSLTNMLERMGVSVPPTAIRVNNTAAVMVTATLPAFAQPGMHIDITAAAIGDASNLQGGILVLTSLRGADGQVYAIAQGPVMTGGFSAGQGRQQPDREPSHRRTRARRRHRRARWRPRSRPKAPSACRSASPISPPRPASSPP